MRKLVLPTLLGSLPSDLRPTLLSEIFRSRLTTLAPKLDSSLVLAVVVERIIYLASRDLGDHDRRANSVSRSLFAFGASGHNCYWRSIHSMN